MSCENYGETCVDTCCLPRAEKPELTAPSCGYQKGIYENVTVEINENCQVVRMWDSERTIIRMCDSCD